MASLNKISLVLVVAVLGSVIAGFTDEQVKILEENEKNPLIKNAKEACKHISETDPCNTNCFYKQLGMLDNSGRYVESKTAESIAILHKGILTQDQANTIAKACNSLNAGEIKPACARAEQVFDCIQEERFKFIGFRP